MLNKKLIYVILLSALMLNGCGDDLTNGTVTTDYTVDGLLFFNPNTDDAFSYAVILEETVALPTLFAYIIVSPTDSSQLTPRGGGAYLTRDDSLTAYPDSSYTLRAREDFGDFSFSMGLEVADTFRVEVVSPASRVYTSGSVSITWNAPSQDFGYFVTIEPPSSEVAPFSAFSTASNYSIDAAAFAKPNGEKVAGWYKIYVVAYSETFYSDPLIEQSDKVFFPYPDSGFTDNIDRIGVSGRMGTAILSYYDSVQVIANP
jgi:hypothetical protein